MAKVQCIKCGKIKYIKPCYLYSNKYNSCICQLKKHNLTNTKIYSIYHNMKYRCNNNHHPEYYNYGGKGVSVCNQWLGENGFTNFYNWSIKNGYKEGLSIDRIDSNDNYCPNNCRWITLSENVARSNKTQHRKANKGVYYGISPDGLYYEFENAAAFSKEHNLFANCIRQVANGKKKMYKNWKFGFVCDIK